MSYTVLVEVLYEAEFTSPEYAENAKKNLENFESTRWANFLSLPHWFRSPKFVSIDKERSIVNFKSEISNPAYLMSSEGFYKYCFNIFGLELKELKGYFRPL